MTACDTRQPCLVRTSWHLGLFTELHKKAHKACRLPQSSQNPNRVPVTRCSEFDLKNPPSQHFCILGSSTTPHPTPPAAGSGVFLRPGLPLECLTLQLHASQKLSITTVTRAAIWGTSRPNSWTRGAISCESPKGRALRGGGVTPCRWLPRRHQGAPVLTSSRAPLPCFFSFIFLN